jgi:hypothetical protein
MFHELVFLDEETAALDEHDEGFEDFGWQPQITAVSNEAAFSRVESERTEGVDKPRWFLWFQRGPPITAVAREVLYFPAVFSSREF